MRTTCMKNRLTLALLLVYVAVCVLAGNGRPSSVHAQPIVEHQVCESFESDHCLSVRGGDGTAARRIQRFLSEKKPSLDMFHVHGWRWHTMAVIREAGRLQKLAEKSSADNDCSPLQKAADYVVGFNLKGLHKIEEKLFFPWMREKLTNVSEKDLAAAFGSVMDQLESDRKKVAKIGESIQKRIRIVCEKNVRSPMKTDAIRGIVEDSAELQIYARSMLEREDSLLVPSIASVVSEDEQKSFNFRVLRTLGLLDGRLHLVAMHEAVIESNNAEEKRLFKERIPSIPQRMIPRWKRNLYNPKTIALD